MRRSHPFVHLATAPLALLVATTFACSRNPAPATERESTPIASPTPEEPPDTSEPDSSEPEWETASPEPTPEAEPPQAKGGGGGKTTQAARSGTDTADPAFGVNVGFYARLLEGGGSVFRRGYRTSRYKAGDEPFDPDFLAVLEPFSVLRFHQFHHVSFSGEKEWSDRASPKKDVPLTEEQIGDGEAVIPYEWEIRMCNAAHADYWVTVPAQASREYIRSLARLVKKELDPGLRVWIEHSNEVWNFDYSDGAGWDPTPNRKDGQNNLAREVGLKVGAEADDMFHQAAFGYTRESLELFGAFEEVFGANSPRVVKVMAWIAPEVDPEEGSWNSLQAVFDALDSPRVTRFEGAPASTRPDVIAINPYFNYPEESKDRWKDLEAALERLDPSLAFTRQVVRENLGPDVKVVGYEGGQHVIWGAAKEMNRDPRMYRLYRRWMEIMREHLDLTAHYALVTPFLEGEAFGLKESIGQPVEQAHKWRALMDDIEAHRR